MSIAISMMCRLPGPLTRSAIIDFIQDEIDFCDDHDPSFDPAPNSAEAASPSWHKLDIHFDDDQLIQFWWASDELIEGTICEAIEERGIKDAALSQRLKQTRMMITIRVGFGGTHVPRGVWDMLACVESWIARTHDGLIVSKEGIYGPDLELIVSS